MNKVVKNIAVMRKKAGFTQAVIAEAIGCDSSNWSKIERGVQSLSVDQLEKIADLFGLRVIDIYTYPDRYVKDGEPAIEKVSVTFEVSPDNREALIRMVSSYNKRI